MKLERTIISNIEYYYFTHTEYYPDIQTSVGDIFTDWRDIDIEREKMKQKWNIPALT